jgi:hypothetical protein
MTLTEIIGTLKTNFNPSKVLISFEKTMGFYNESDNASKENDIKKGPENNPYRLSQNSNQFYNWIMSNVNFKFKS